MRTQRAGKVHYGMAVGLLLFAGGSHRYRNALHPAYGQSDFDRDWDECQRENTQPRARAETGGPSVAYRTYPMAVACMRARGWQHIE
jgi:hypothetical protein